jgi:hypothetical protein
VSSGSQNRKRQQLLPVRCTAEELHELRAAKEAGGFDTMADFIRARCLRTSRAPRVPLVDRQQLARLLAEAGKIGSNVNQLARVANTHGELPTAAELETIWREVSAIRSALMGALGHGD